MGPERPTCDTCRYYHAPEPTPYAYQSDGACLRVVLLTFHGPRHPPVFRTNGCRDHAPTPPPPAPPDATLAEWMAAGNWEGTTDAG
jgi:hypothetical protein